ncbi:MAG TPA: hypothetical protein VEI27_02045 [Dehalococcoidales bacterium]|nr:hypothetical protein [Dehalococcoidales bacterium]
MEEKNNENTVEAKIAQLKETLAGREKEVAENLTRVGVLERQLQERESELAAARQQAADIQVKLTAATGELSKAVGSYRSLIIKSYPGIAEDLISGDTIEAVDTSLKKAQKLTEHIRQELEKEGVRQRIPVGAPGRISGSDAELSPREKINYGIGGKK